MTVNLFEVSHLAAEVWEHLAISDAIIFGCPTYMGSASGPFKTFMDQTSKIWLERGWRNKLAAGFTVSGFQSGDKFATLAQLATFSAQHSMIWVILDQLPGNNSTIGSAEDVNRLGASLEAMAQANVDQGPNEAPPASDKESAALLGERVAELATIFRIGRNALEPAGD